MEQFFIEFFEAISPALQQLIAALVIAALTAFTAWVKAKYDTERAHLTDQQQYIVMFLIENAVKAAQQLYDDNTEKRNYALNMVETQLKVYGIKIELGVIVGLIEAEVFRFKDNFDLKAAG